MLTSLRTILTRRSPAAVTRVTASKSRRQPFSGGHGHGQSNHGHGPAQPYEIVHHKTQVLVVQQFIAKCQKFIIKCIRERLKPMKSLTIVGLYLYLQLQICVLIVYLYL